MCKSYCFRTKRLFLSWKYRQAHCNELSWDLADPEGKQAAKEGKLSGFKCTQPLTVWPASIACPRLICSPAAEGSVPPPTPPQPGVCRLYLTESPQSASDSPLVALEMSFWWSDFAISPADVRIKFILWAFHYSASFCNTSSRQVPWRLTVIFSGRKKLLKSYAATDSRSSMEPLDCHFWWNHKQLSKESR